MNHFNISDLRLEEMGLHKIRPRWLWTIEGRETFLAWWRRSPIPSRSRNLGALGEDSTESILSLNQSAERNILKHHREICAFVCFGTLNIVSEINEKSKKKKIFCVLSLLCRFLLQIDVCRITTYIFQHISWSKVYYIFNVFSRIYLNYTMSLKLHSPVKGFQSIFLFWFSSN